MKSNEKNNNNFLSKEPVQRMEYTQEQVMGEGLLVLSEVGEESCDDKNCQDDIGK